MNAQELIRFRLDATFGKDETAYVVDGWIDDPDNGILVKKLVRLSETECTSEFILEQKYSQELWDEVKIKYPIPFVYLHIPQRLMPLALTPKMC